MTANARRNPWTHASLGGLLTATVVVLAATAAWLFLREGHSDYAALISGAWTTLTVFWALFIVQRLRRRHAA